ncbi:polyphosphate kinase 2 [Egicoccus halophilus]|uniref:ADP/GDP-polyphosphate phosphotransferase n=1 Tax=Egicoccus halophilus TaxID=1670830 RepID=A0A8J3ETD0_9ACTN|nr:polyphosphate kinase 2 [Egicoccus halophilus]GGI09313.1 polyphosphate kinase 2 [Egicoccus halophilus]
MTTSDDERRPAPEDYRDGKLRKKVYERELSRLQVELVKLQQWIKDTGHRAVVLFEGRDAAGKGGAIERITSKTNPRVVRTVALGVPSDRQKTQWYFQRYVEQLPAAGELVLFDRSWYNRAGVERVMGFATEDEVAEFFRSVPEFERLLQRAGIQLVKYWFSVSDEEQERRFRARAEDPTKRWKLSPMDLASWERWEEYSRAKDDMFAHTDTDDSPWWVIDAEVKRHARLNCIAHLLDQFPYTDVTPERIELPPRPPAPNVDRPPIEHQRFVPRRY